MLDARIEQSHIKEAVAKSAARLKCVLVFD